ncbi:STAS domain-containing protein [Dactylosporangium sp. NPDC051541]|uniref:STAS domain-containing protein n=1 Tax=Dactylosporangium sp. NPDC051541 TaxID=3363977 RepID=UPI00378A94A9
MERTGVGGGFRCPVTEDYPIVVVSPRGVLDAAGAATLRQAVAKALTARPDLVLLDVARLRPGPDLALSVLPMLARRASSAGAAFVLCGPSPALAAALQRVIVCRRLPVCASLQDALAERAAHPVPTRRHAFLPPLRSSAEAARAIVTEACAAWDVTVLSTAAEAVTGELVANAVLHAGTEIGFSVELGRYYLVVAVRDGSPVLPRLRTPDDDGPGYGLLLVDGLASAWRCAPTATGKIVWASLRRPRSG